MKTPKIWFAWACNLSRKSVEPLYEAAVAAGYDCTLECRGGYTDLVARMKPYTHYVFGVGPDTSWNHARQAGLVSINIMHGQYVFRTWPRPTPDHTIFTGEAYIEDAKKTFVEQGKYYAPGYIRADILKTYVDNPVKDIDCLVALPMIGEHRHLRTMDVINEIKDVPGVVFRVHPRNSKVRTELIDMGATVDTAETFYGSLSRAKCLLSGPSNCIIEACHFKIPVGLFALLPEFEEGVRLGREEIMTQRYHSMLVDTYSPLATVFTDANHLRNWITDPVAKDPSNAKRYWANVDGDVQPVIDCFLNILKENINSPDA